MGWGGSRERRASQRPRRWSGDADRYLFSAEAVPLPRFSGKNASAGNGWILSGGGGAGAGLLVSAMASAYSEGKRPPDRLHAEHEHGALEGELQLVDRLLVPRLPIARSIRDTQLRVGRVVEQRIKIRVGRAGVDREP